MKAILNREAVPDNAGSCRHCIKEAIAVWRCKNCTSATLKCRSCMRKSHQENTFHKIEQWNGSYFRPAELWEVGTYLLVPHFTGEAICTTLNLLVNQIDAAEEIKDDLEQSKLLQESGRREPVPVPVPVPGTIQSDFFDNIDTDNREQDQIDGDDEADDYMDDCYDNLEDEENETPITMSSGTGTGAGAILPCDTSQYFIRVVHTNGLHNIAMINCPCHGQDDVPLDLFAVQLLPTSFKRIKTLFTAKVLDLFRLCNLELKASAYQFYQLLRRLTRPMAPAEVTDLYREFRRMSRLWRWMKKLKWNGYGSNNKMVSEVQAGELAIYCPACPQPGINIPHNWMEDPARHVLSFNPKSLRN